MSLILSPRGCRVSIPGVLGGPRTGRDPSVPSPSPFQRCKGGSVPPADHFFSSSSGSPIYLASSRQQVAPFPSAQPPRSRGCSCHGATSGTGALPRGQGPHLHALDHGASPGCCGPGEGLRRTAHPPNLRSRGRQGGVANTPRPSHVLRVPPRIPPQHPRGSPSPRDPFGFAPRGRALTHGWDVSPLVPRPGSALPVSACASPRGSPHGPSPAGRVSPGFPIAGGRRHKNRQHPGRRGAGSGRPVPPPRPGVNPSPAAAPALTPGGNGSPKRVQ